MALCMHCIFVTKIRSISISKMWPYFHTISKIITEKYF